MTWHRMSNRGFLTAVVALAASLLVPGIATGAGRDKSPPSEPQYNVTKLDFGVYPVDRLIRSSSANYFVVGLIDTLVVLDASLREVAAIALPSEAMLRQALAMPDNHSFYRLSFVGGAGVLNDGTVLCTVSGVVRQAAPVGEEKKYVGDLYRFTRAYVAVPSLDALGEIDYQWMDLGVGFADGDAEGIDAVVSLEIRDVSDSGCVVGSANYATYTDQTKLVNGVLQDGRLFTGRSYTAFRIMPLRDDAGRPVTWCVDEDGVNALIELISAPCTVATQAANAENVDSFGRAVIWDRSDESCRVIMPYTQQVLPLGSSADRFWPRAMNETGLIVGGYDRTKPGAGYRPTYPPLAPCYVQGIPAADNTYRWYQPQKNGSNALLVKPGLLTDYSDVCDILSVSEAGQMVGYAESYTRGRRAVTWENNVAIDLNTRIDSALGITLTWPTITKDGVIFCVGTEDGTTYHLYKLVRR